MKVFVLRADYGRYTNVFKNNNYVGIGWSENSQSTLISLYFFNYFFLFFSQIENAQTSGINVSNTANVPTT